MVFEKCIKKKWFKEFPLCVKEDFRLMRNYRLKPQAFNQYALEFAPSF